MIAATRSIVPKHVPRNTLLPCLASGDLDLKTRERAFSQPAP